MKAFLKRLFCRHNNLSFWRNIYGDEIISAGYKRSWWRCDKCGIFVLKDDLHDTDSGREPMSRMISEYHEAQAALAKARGEA